MGTVWRGHRLHQQRPVAVKLVVGQSSQEPWARASFLNEVRAAASLNHPGVVTVLDHGVVDELAHAASGGVWPVGSPYLVMEYVDGRPLHDLVGRLPWPQLKDVLEQLLSALAHSHARRVVHRDIKPGNVLVRATPDGLRVKLSDFGLARLAAEDAAAERTIAGTPAYMAPEQLRGALRDQDTWTDLYSVGCLAWALSAGAPPFGRRRSLDEFRADHGHRAPPPLIPMMQVPVSFEAWLRRLLSKRPADRYTTAADALDALRHLPDDGPTLSGPVPPVRGEDDLLGADLVSLPPGTPGLGEADTGGANRGLDDSTFDLPADGEANPPPPEEERRPLLPRTRAPFPERWLSPAEQQRGPSSAEALRLFGLRRAPLFGRHQLRGLLVDRWRAVVEGGRPRVILLRGPEGCGKGRLTAELGERAHEQAGYWTLRVRPAAHGQGGLAAALAERTGCLGLPLEEAAERLRRLGLAESADSARALAYLVCPPREEPTGALPAVAFARPDEGQALLLHALLQLDPAAPLRGHDEPSPRPGLLWLDEPSAEPALVELALGLLEPRMPPAPILCVITVQDAVIDGAGEGSALARLLAQPGVEVHEVGPLAMPEHERLVRSLIGDDDELVREISQRTAGNPLFAVQLVTDWISRGLLSEGADGWQLVRGLPMDLPDSLHAVWLPRVEQIIDAASADRPRERDALGRALELAATLGEAVDAKVWAAACARARTKPDGALVQALIGHRLAELTPGGWRFTQPLLRESLQRRAREGGRWAAHHRTCATALELQGRGVHTERVAAHLLAAGDDRDALPYLLRAAEERLARGELADTDRTLERRALAMDRAKVPADDELRGLDTGLRLQALRRQGRIEETVHRAELALERAAAARWIQAQAQALLEAAVAYQLLGRPARAWRRLRQLEELPAFRGEEPLRARGQLEQGRLLLEAGRLAEAKAALDAARSRLGGAAQVVDLATLEQLLGRVARQAGALDAAREHALASMQSFAKAGHRWGMASAQNELGEIARLRGDLTEAERAYTEALRRLRELGGDEGRVVRINLAIVLQLHRRYREARPLLVDALSGTAASGLRSVHAVVHLLLLCCAAADGAWGEWDERLAVAQSMLNETEFVDLDVAQALERAAQLAREQGQAARARAAWRAAAAQWAALGRSTEAQRCAAAAD
jgi:serine/threonine protein kinase/tetratricopeptide (TPR) repeat protein